MATTSVNIKLDGTSLRLTFSFKINAPDKYRSAEPSIKNKALAQQTS